jgi:hypothetical protein
LFVSFIIDIIRKKEKEGKKMKDKKGTIKVSEYQKDEFRKNYQKPEVTDLGKVSEKTFTSDPVTTVNFF